MIEALRGLGYSTATAIADIIDNSISAGASTIDIRFVWKEDDSVIAIQDDGVGMDDAELDRAMRLGEKSPLAARDSRDLGRFGIGLKTASFSQCRRLTVASRRKGGSTGCLCWDLDVLAAAADDGWHLLEGPEETSRDLLAPIAAAESGTLVLWERLDRILVPGFCQQNFLDLIDTVERHLAMIFHRYLDRVSPPLRIRLNGRSVAPWDPFLTAHPATWTSPLVPLRTENGLIEVQGHVLPHQDRLDQRQREAAGGPDGWTAQQGFYVYRNRRLLVAGSWLGLGSGRSWTKEEAHRLARIRLDIPNSADADWKVDVRKSTARPPVQMRPQLTSIAEHARAMARRVFARRGRKPKPDAGQAVAEAWRAERFAGGIRYRIDLNHPVVRAVLEDSGILADQIRKMLRILEETVPVQRIWLDTMEGRETPSTGFSATPTDEIKDILEVMFRNLVTRRGVQPDLAREQLLHTEPFDDFPDLVAALRDEQETRP